ncbi:MAG: sigma-E processing peptidase SpoIIGA [Clostridiaceae bacterium]|nr:sigma-E processing peptidase SpoIIGA [Clostridiaceae bacterium]
MVKPVVYIDVLFVINLIINYLLLWTTSKISKKRASTMRILAGAVLGAVYAVVMFFPAFKIYYTFIAKILFSMVLIAVTFNIEKAREFVKVLTIFYVVSFTFGGAALGLFYFTNVGAFIGALVSNGVIYFTLPWKVLLLSSMIAYIIIRITWSIIARKMGRENMFVPLVIIFDNKSICVNALIDTGNSLYDPISKFPVVVVEFNAIKELLPEDIQQIFSECSENDLNLISKIMSNSDWVSRFRLIPFTSLGKENGMLIGFKPDEVEIMEGEEKKDIKDIIVGVYNKKLSKDETYRALLNPEIIGLQ